MLGYSLIVLGLIALGLALALLHWLLNADGMLWVQVRRRLVVLRFFLFTLRRNKPVPLDAVYAAVTATYAASGFTRQLGPDEVAQLALQAGFSQPAAAALRARAVADAAVQAQARNAGEDAKLTTLLAAQRSGAARRLPTVTIPRWRLKYFMWWLHSHLHTLNILRTEWEHESPLLICGFDVTRDAADALLFRRPKVGSSGGRGHSLVDQCVPATVGWPLNAGPPAAGCSWHHASASPCTRLPLRSCAT
jgi:hypothetical protein